MAFVNMDFPCQCISIDCDSSYGHNQGSGIGGGRGVNPPGRKNFENTPLRFWKKYTPPLGGAKRRRNFFGRIFKINVNLTEFSLNLVKLTLI